jgi:hypothetical protein
MTCYGCGRLLGLRAELECPCWLSYRDSAIIPERLVAPTKRARLVRSPSRRGER